MTREEAMHELMQAVHQAITSSDEVNAAIERLRELGLEMLRIRAIADLETGGQVPIENSDADFLKFLRIVPDLKVSEP